jgi:hypothetical protein
MSKVLSRSILSQVGSALSEINHSFLLTIKHLTYQPKEVVDSYLNDAKQSPYSSPFRYLFVITSIYMLVASWLGFDISGILKEQSKEPIGIDSEGISLIENSIVFLAFISWVPASWFMSKLVKSSQKSSGDCYIVALYVEAQMLLWQGLIGLPLVYFVFESYHVLSLIYLLFLPFIAWCYKRIFNFTLTETIWKTLLIQLANFFFQMILIFTLSFGIGISQAINQANNKEPKTEKISSEKPEVKQKTY